MNLDISESEINITASNPENETAHEIIDCSSEISMKIGVNSDYLLDVINNTTGGEFEMLLSNQADKPILIKTTTNEYVLMPMRI